MFSGRGNHPGGGASQEGAGPDTSLGSSRDILDGRAASGGHALWCPLCAKEGRESCFQQRGTSPGCSPRSVGAGGGFPLRRHPGTAWWAMGHPGDREMAPSPSQHTQKSSSDHTHPSLHPSLSVVPCWNAAQVGSSCLARLQAKISLSTGSSPSPCVQGVWKQAALGSQCPA